MQQALTATDSTTTWAQYTGVLRTFEPFWQQSIEHLGNLIETPKQQVQDHRTAASTAFDLFGDWYLQRAPIVKARRNDIDGAISFIRNSALRTEVSHRTGAAMSRNLAAVLRPALTMATHGYNTQVYPRTMTGGLLTLAAVKSQFPVSISDLVEQFSVPNQSPLDDIDQLWEILRRAAAHYGLEKNLEFLEQTLIALWQQLAQPQQWEAPSEVWAAHSNSLFMKAHTDSVRAFKDAP